MASVLADVCFAKLIKEARLPEKVSITLPGTRGFEKGFKCRIGTMQASLFELLNQ